MGVLGCGIAQALRLQQVADLAFGRDYARYWQLIAFMTAVSLVLGGLLLVTTILRLVTRFALYRRPRHGDDAASAVNTTMER